ncbi:MAG: hypothetical protein WAN12_01595 [Candidatus Acidiferrum sp.]
MALAFSLWILYGFGYETLYQRLVTQVEGVIVSSRDVHSPNNPRYATEYIVRAADGREAGYVAGASDASLPRSLPVGTTIKKRKWHLDYERDGEHVSDFPTALYVLTLGAAVAGLVWSIRLWRQQRMAAK